MFRLKTLGGVALDRDGSPLEGRITQRRRLALLAYLAAARERAVTREHIVALLWPERSEDQARHSLSQILYALRSDLGADAVIAGVDELRLNVDVVASDIRDFDRAIEARDWMAATTSYRGPFLDGFHLNDAPEFENWASRERDRYARDYGRALEALAADYATRDVIAAAECWRKRAALDPLDARVAMALMEALAAAGDRAGAQRHAQVHATLLRSELDAPPDAEVVALAARMQRDAGAAVLSPARTAAAAPEHHDVPDPPIVPARPRRPRMNRAALMLGSVMVLVALFAARWMMSVETLPRVIVLGDVIGPDTTLALAVREALQAELAASSSVRLVPESRVRESRRLMGLAQDGALSPLVMQDLAQRHGAQAVLVGSATPLGKGVQLLVRIIDPTNGRLLYAVAEHPASDDDVVGAVVRLGRSVREKLGAIAIDTTARALPMVTTSSLAALRYYALAQREITRDRRAEAALLAEAAIAEDSSFALAHYIVGDQLWFLNSEARSQIFMKRAFALSGRAPLRERLLIRARYQQLVLDEPDSALVTWRMLLAIRPEDPFAYDGITWTLRSLGEFRQAAAMADSGLRLNPAALIPHMVARTYALLSIGDTMAARVSPNGPLTGGWLAQVEFAAAMMRGDYPAASRWADSIAGKSQSTTARFRRLHIALASGQMDSATEHWRVLRGARDGYTWRGAVTYAMVIAPTRRDEARELGRLALGGVATADISPPAIARIVEKVAVVAAWTHDPEILREARRVLEMRDAHRGLRTFRIALDAIDASMAYVQGDYGEAARRLGLVMRDRYFARTMSTLMLLAADANVAAGNEAAARTLYNALAMYRFREADPDIMWVTAPLAAARLARLPSTAPSSGR